MIFRNIWKAIFPSIVDEKKNNWLPGGQTLAFAAVENCCEAQIIKRKIVFRWKYINQLKKKNEKFIDKPQSRTVRKSAQKSM
jgi:hypothetical protein